MIYLRNNTKTSDPRLDRIEYFDPRSRAFPVTTGLPEEPITKLWDCPQHLDQGREGACVGFGCTHELISDPIMVKSLTNAYAQGIYKDAQKIDPWPGEDYSGTSVLAGVQICQQRGWIEEYRWAFGIEDLILGISHKGPAVIGIRWHRNMRNTDANGFIHASGGIRGGHCTLVKGVNVEEDYGTIHNSWGKGWGVDGDAKISFRDLERLLNEGGDAAFFIGRHLHTDGCCVE